MTYKVKNTGDAKIKLMQQPTIVSGHFGKSQGASPIDGAQLLGPGQSNDSQHAFSPMGAGVGGHVDFGMVDSPLKHSAPYMSN